MALYVLFENKNTFLFLYFICLLLKWYQIILPDPVYQNDKQKKKKKKRKRKKARRFR